MPDTRSISAPAPEGTSRSNLAACVNWGLESLWLLSVLLVPLAYLGREFISTEAVIGYVELPKVALLRTLTGLIAILWLVEWGIQGRLPSASLFKSEGLLRRPPEWLPRMKAWLANQPSRWLLLAASLFLFTTLLTTLLSASFDVSLWGEVPGQDGYSAYTTVAYFVLFGVIATHLRTRPQLWRLLSAITLMGVLVAGYAVFQHYGHDFLGLTEITGGGTGRVTSFMGNAIFAAAVMIMTIPITLVLAVVSFPGSQTAAGMEQKRIARWTMVAVLLAFWGIVLAVQILGLTFTFSRGPWLGFAFAMVVLFGSVGVFVGWRALGRATLLLASATAFALLVLHWQGTLSILGLPSWTITIMALVVFAGTVTALVNWERLGRIFLGVALGVAVLAAVLLANPLLEGGGGGAAEPTGPAETRISSQVSNRLASIKAEVAGGLLGGRRTHWEVSWELIRDHPWAEFKNLSLPWLRPIVGYGPDLFRYTYLLESPPEGRDSLPTEPDHAHNFFIHQTVVQGFLGLLSSLGIFAAALLVTGGSIIRSARELSGTHKLIALGLLAVVAGRFVEMMVGVARVSDLTILWVVLAVLVALPVVMRSRCEEAAVEEPTPPPDRATRRMRSRRNAKQGGGKSDRTLIWRLAIVAWLVGGIGALIWVKNVNYVRAGVAVADAVEQFNKGDLQSTLGSLDKAIDLAPDVSIYHNHRASVYLAFQLRADGPRETGCSQQESLPYQVCLAAQSLQSNLDAIKQRPLYYRHQLAAGNSAYNLTEYGLAVDYYQRALKLLPMSWPIRNEIADAYIEAGEPAKALPLLEESLRITENSPSSARRGYYLQGVAYKELGDLEKSSLSMQRGLQVGLSGDFARQARAVIAEHLLEARMFEQALAPLDEILAVDPDAPEAHALRGIAFNELGQHQRAIQEFEETLNIDPEYEIDLGRFGISYFQTGRYAEAVQALDRAIETGPGEPRLMAYRGITYQKLGLNDLALIDLNEAIEADPSMSEPRYLRGLVNLSLGSLDAAAQDVDEAIRIDPGRPAYLIARGDVLNASGQLPQAKEEYAKAVELSAQDSRFEDETLEEIEPAVLPGRQESDYYRQRGLGLYRLGRYRQAVDTYDQAITFYPGDADFYVSRGVALHALGLYDRAIADYDQAILMRAGSLYLRIPEFFFYFFNRGLAYLQQGRYHKAIADMNSARDFEPPDLAEAFIIRGISSGQLGNVDSAAADLGRFRVAIQDLPRAFKINPNRQQVFYTRGLANLHLGQYLLATAYFDEALRLDSDDSLSYIERGMAYSLAGDHQQAVKDLDRALELDGDNPEVHFKHGLAALRAGEYQIWAGALAEAVRLTPILTDPELVDKERSRVAAEFRDRASPYLYVGMDDEAQRNIEIAIETGLTPGG